MVHHEKYEAFKEQHKHRYFEFMEFYSGYATYITTGADRIGMITLIINETNIDNIYIENTKLYTLGEIVEQYGGEHMISSVTG